MRHTPTGRPYDAVLFDCDGVLVDSEGVTNEVLRLLLAEHGWQLDRAECRALFIGRALHDRAELIADHTDLSVADVDGPWLAEFRRRRNVALRAHLEPTPGIHDAVAAVAEAFPGRIACVSGADRAKVEMQLGIVGLDGYFAGSIFSGMETERSKPFPDVYLLAARTLGIDPARAVVVEDSPPGVTAGVAAGMTVLGFCPGDETHTAPDLVLAAGAVTTFASMTELAGLVT